MSKTMLTLQLIAFLYFAIGTIHLILFSLLISRLDCLSGTGLVATYCNTGEGISHFVVIVGWPFYWLW